MTRLANIFFVLDVQYSNLEKKESEEYLTKIIKPFTEALYRQETDIHIYLEDGSLKINIAIVGALYIAIGQYGSFRSGLESLKNDAKFIESYLVNDMSKNGLSSNKITTRKTNAGVSSSLLRLMNRIEKLKEFNKNDEKYQREIENIVHYTLKLIENTPDDNDKKLIVNVVHEADKEHLVTKRLPKTPSQDRNNYNAFYIRNTEDKLKVINEDEDLKLYLQKQKAISKNLSKFDSMPNKGNRQIDRPE